MREDVGRHTALDKLIVALLEQSVDARSGFVLVTSRASFEMIRKTTVLGAPDRRSVDTHPERVVGLRPESAG